MKTKVKLKRYINRVGKSAVYTFRGIYISKESGLWLAYEDYPTATMIHHHAETLSQLKKKIENHIS